jgi:acyl carrier protein
VTEESIEQTIKELMVERLYLKVKPEQIRDETPIMQELGVDSVSVFEIVVGLEETFGISMDDREFRLETFRTPRSIADFVRRKLKERNAGA